MKKSRCLLLFLMSLLTISVAAQPKGQKSRRPPRQQNEQRQPMKVDSAFAAKFEAHSQNLRGIDLPYRLAAIGDVESQSPILVVYLHGRHGSGKDNLNQLTKRGVHSLYNYLERNGISSYLLVPQCPENRHWNEREKDGWQMTNVVKEVIDGFVLTHGIDTHRVFIFGDSMGGVGVYRMLNDYPSYFAAAMAAASSPRDGSAGKIAKTPLCCIMGSEDDIVDTDATNKLVNSLKKKKADLRYELLEGKTHQQTCRDAFTDENIEWVLNHTR